MSRADKYKILLEAEGNCIAAREIQKFSKTVTFDSEHTEKTVLGMTFGVSDFLIKGTRGDIVAYSRNFFDRENGLFGRYSFSACVSGYSNQQWVDDILAGRENKNIQSTPAYKYLRPYDVRV
jgi:hypothetical protein